MTTPKNMRGGRNRGSQTISQTQTSSWNIWYGGIGALVISSHFSEAALPLLLLCLFTVTTLYSKQGRLQHTSEICVTVSGKPKCLWNSCRSKNESKSKAEKTKR